MNLIMCPQSVPTSETTCAKYSANYKVSDCSLSEFQCINCKKAAESLNIDIDSLKG